MLDAKHPPGSRNRHQGPTIALVIAVLLLASACTTGSGTEPDEWFRDYVSTYERVFEAAISALDDSDFYLDTVDEERGRIRARSSARRADLEATLLVDIRQKGDRIRVDVLAQSSGLEEGRAPVQVSGVVRDFFHHLDARLEGRTN